MPIWAQHTSSPATRERGEQYKNPSRSELRKKHAMNFPTTARERNDPRPDGNEMHPRFRFRPPPCALSAL